MKLQRGRTSVGRLAITTVFAKSQFIPRTLISVLKRKYFGRSALVSVRFKRQLLFHCRLHIFHTYYTNPQNPTPLLLMRSREETENTMRREHYFELRWVMRERTAKRSGLAWIYIGMPFRKKYLFLPAANFSVHMLQRRYTTEMKKITSCCTKKPENISKTSSQTNYFV